MADINFLRHRHPAARSLRTGTLLPLSESAAEVMIRGLESRRPAGNDAVQAIHQLS